MSTSSTSRRSLLRGATALAGTLAAASAAPAAAQNGRGFGRGVGQGRPADGVIAENPARRAAEAFRTRLQAARDLFASGRAPQATNGDEARYGDLRAVFAKTLPHDELGEPDRAAYATLTDALRRNTDRAYEAITLDQTVRTRRLANPQAAFAVGLTGYDGQASRMPAAPAFASEETAGEMVELYWKALLRDVPFARFETDGRVARAAAEIASHPVPAGGATGVSDVFRGETVGDRTGPFVSQLLLREVPFGNGSITQRYPTPARGADFMTGYEEWLTVQRGGVVGATDKRGARYIHDGRSLAEYVHVDFTYQAYLNAALILLGLGPDFAAQGSPARRRTTTGTFVTFGAADVVDVVSRAANQALHAAWFQKWCVHRRLRPETYGGRLHNQVTGAKAYDIPESLADSEAVARTRRRQETALLSMAYPEGSPTHPAYPAGHATVAGACCTVLKAFFDEDMALPDPVTANENGTGLVSVPGRLTVGGEIDKLASNVTLGRDWAGVHYRSDGVEGMTVGETVAIGLLKDHAATYSGDFDGFVFRRFDGTRVRVTARGAAVA